MSTCTENWTEEKIRHILQNLDIKTGLSGSRLPITFKNSIRRLGTYFPQRKAFEFNKAFFDNPATKEAEVIDVIRHEYAHYYDDVVGIQRYLPHAKGQTHHGADWKYACRMVGAMPERLHDRDNFAGADWGAAEALAAYSADDVRHFYILPFVQRWNQLPVEQQVVKVAVEALRRTNMYLSRGDRVLHSQRGFGEVQDVIVSDAKRQKVYVRFDDTSAGVFYGDELRRL